MTAHDFSATLDDVGAEFGVSRERIRQLQKLALEKVRLVRAWLRMQLAELGSYRAVAEAEGLPVRVIQAYCELAIPGGHPVDPASELDEPLDPTG